VLLWAAALLLGCSPSPARPPNILLISIDTARADHFSAYGYERDTTPVLAALAREGALFESAFAPSATTAPSHASLFTSAYPLAHRVVKNGRVLAPHHETLAERLREGGYQTGGSFRLMSSPSASVSTRASRPGTKIFPALM
jgi:arylsulfatase A-like enzyme